MALLGRDTLVTGPLDDGVLLLETFQGKLNKTKPVIHTVVFEPDHMRVSVVWRGSAPALRPYMPEELAKMPLKVEW
jgi:hypothetical protein